MERLLHALLSVCLLSAAVAWVAAADGPFTYENPSHEALRWHLRAALDPSRTEALDEAIDTASVTADSRLVRKLLGQSYRDFGAGGRVQNFNRLLANRTVQFMTSLLGLLGVDLRHQADLQEIAFDAPAAANRTGVWMLHKLAHWPRGSREGGIRLSCLLVHGVGGGASFDVVIVTSLTADVSIGDADLLIVETKPAEQMGLLSGREAILTRTGRESGLTEGDVMALMTLAELNCLRKLGAHFQLAYDT